MVRNTSTRPDDALLREAMKAVATERRRFGAAGSARDPRTGWRHSPARQTGDDRVRQRHGVHLDGDPALVPGDRRRVALHRPPASRRRMPSSRASTDASGMRASTTRCSRRSLKPATPSAQGRRANTGTDLTRPSATSRPPSSHSNPRWKNRPLRARNQTQDSPSGRRRKGSQVSDFTFVGQSGVTDEALGRSEPARVWVFC